MDRFRGLANVGLAAVAVGAAWLVLNVTGVLGDAAGVREVAETEPRDRAEVIRRLVRERPAGRRPALLRGVVDLEGGEGLATEVLLATIESDPAGADAVLDAYREALPDSPFLPSWTIAARARQGRVDEAARLYREAVARAGPDVVARRGVVNQFAQVMADVGLTSEAYAATDRPDAEYAFRALAERLDHPASQGDEPAKRAAALRKLVAAHESRLGRSPASVYYAAVADDLDGDDESAQARFAEALRSPAPPADASPWDDRGIDRGHASFRRSGCLLRLGRWEQAYDEAERKDEVFEWLCRVFDRDGRADDLEKLAGRRRAEAPDDPTIPYWEAAVRWGRGDYAGAIPLLDDHLARATGSRLYVQEASDRKFRGLVRLGRMEEARKMVDAPAALRWPEQVFWDMIVAAKDGDEAALGRMLDQLAASRIDGAALAYADPDLGLLFREDRFAALRDRYPPPDR